MSLFSELKLIFADFDFEKTNHLNLRNAHANIYFAGKEKWTLIDHEYESNIFVPQLGIIVFFTVL